MSVPSMVEELGRVDEPLAAIEFSAALTQVASEHRPVIVCRNGEDLAAVVSLEHLELLREALARQDVEARAARIDWDRVRQRPGPPQSWFDDDDNPFEPDEEATS